MPIYEVNVNVIVEAADEYLAREVALGAEDVEGKHLIGHAFGARELDPAELDRAMRLKEILDGIEH